MKLLNLLREVGTQNSPKSPVRWTLSPQKNELSSALRRSHWLYTARSGSQYVTPQIQVFLRFVLATTNIIFIWHHIQLKNLKYGISSTLLCDVAIPFDCFNIIQLKIFSMALINIHVQVVAHSFFSIFCIAEVPGFWYTRLKPRSCNYDSRNCPLLLWVHESKWMEFLDKYLAMSEKLKFYRICFVIPRKIIFLVCSTCE